MEDGAVGMEVAMMVWSARNSGSYGGGGEFNGMSGKHEESKGNYGNGGAGGKAGQKFAKVTYLATQITALVEEMNRRIIDEGAKITDADGNEIALTLEQLNEKYDTLLAENANVDANLETESLKFDSENLIYIGMLVATVTAMADGFTSLAKKTDMS